MASDAAIPDSTREKWFFSFPVDKEGIATSDAAYQLIRYPFENHHWAHAIPQMADALVLHPELVRCMCRQLELIDLVFRNHPKAAAIVIAWPRGTPISRPKWRRRLLTIWTMPQDSGPPALARR